MAMNIDTLLNARWVIPVEPDNVVYEHWSVAVNNGRIVDLLPGDEAVIKYSAYDEIDLDNHVLLPGLINGHPMPP